MCTLTVFLVMILFQQLCIAAEQNTDSSAPEYPYANVEADKIPLPTKSDISEVTKVESIYFLYNYIYHGKLPSYGPFACICAEDSSCLVTTKCFMNVPKYCHTGEDSTHQARLLDRHISLPATYYALLRETYQEQQKKAQEHKSKN